MWKASLILILTIVISFYETSAQESDNSEKESGLRPTTASNKENNVNEAYTNLPVTSELPNMAQNIENKLTRVTYDQRQEGQYNIRADLDNFLIVLVPPNPSSGINLLDILTRSSLKRSSSNKGHKKHQLLKKTIPSGKGGYNSGYESRQHSQHNDGSQPSEHYEYIEGRTPYRVDISSENEFSKAHPYPQVEVLPPSHPLQSHLMKPYHLDADPGIMQKAALIPPEGA